MKKIIALVLAIMMIASMSVVAFAEEEPAGPTYGTEKDTNSIDEKDTSKDSKTGNTKVDYKPVMGYLVIIPGDLELVENTTENEEGETYYGLGKGDIAIKSAKIPSSKKLELTVSGANADVTTGDNYGWTLNDDAQDLNVMYNISLTGRVGNAKKTDVDDTNIDQGDILLYYESGKGFKEQSATMIFTTEEIITAGNFTDNLTFTAKVLNKAN